MAHKPFYLVLLYSYSDTVHRGLLHKTLISTLLIPFCLPHNKPNKAFCSAKRIADNRASLTPRIARLLYFNLSGEYLQVFLIKKGNSLIINFTKPTNNFILIYVLF